MSSFSVSAHLKSLEGEMRELLLLGPYYRAGQIQNNYYVFKVDDKLCVGLLNWFVCEYYVDDVYAIINENDENYRKYKEHL